MTEAVVVAPLGETNAQQNEQSKRYAKLLRRANCVAEGRRDPGLGTVRFSMERRRMRLRAPS